MKYDLTALTAYMCMPISLLQFTLQNHKEWSNFNLNTVREILNVRNTFCTSTIETKRLNRSVASVKDKIPLLWYYNVLTAGRVV